MINYVEKLWKVNYIKRNSPLSIQNIIGGGKPTGGLQCNTRESPSLTWFGSSFSLVHKGDPTENN